jgi:hypothetical protein
LRFHSRAGIATDNAVHFKRRMHRYDARHARRCAADFLELVGAAKLLVVKPDSRKLAISTGWAS